MRNWENAGRLLRKFGIALIAAMVFFVMLGAGKVYADITLTKEWLESNSYTLSGNETYVLDGDLTLKKGLKVSSADADVTLKLQGHTLKLELSADEYESVIYLSNGKLTIEGKDSSGNIGKIQGGKGNRQIHENPGVTSKMCRGGGIAISTGKVEVRGVEISGNTALYGAGVYVCERGTFTMDEDTVIKENKIFKQLGYPWRDGAGVFIDNAIFNMNGGTITLNESDGGWGGVFVGEKGSNEAPAEVNISGNAYIFTNTGNPNPSQGVTQYQNLKLGEGKYGDFLMNVQNLGEKARIGVYMQTPGIFTKAGSITAPADMTKFYSDMTDYVVIRNTDMSLELIKRSEVEGTFYTAEDYEGEYDGEEHGITLALKEGVNAGVSYGTEQADYSLDEPPLFTEAGTYSVNFQIVPATDYPWVQDVKHVTITKRDLSKADISLKSDILYYNRAAQEPELSVVDFKKDVDPSQYTVTYKKDDSEIPAEDVKLPGQYKVCVTATDTEGSNYTGSVELPFEIQADKPEFGGCSLILGGSIGVNFYLYAPERAYLDYTDSELTFTVEHEDEPQVFRFDPDTTEKDEKGRYIYTCFVNSVQMADKIQASFNYIFEGEEQEPVTKEYSVKDYVEAVEAKTQAEYPEKLRNLVQSLADFGHYAQIYLEAIRDWSIGTDHEEMDKYYTKKYSDKEITSAKSALGGMGVKTSLSSKIAKVTYSLYLDSDTAIYVYFKPAENYKGGAEATVNGIKAKVLLTEDGRFKVVIPNIAAHRLGRNYIVRLITDDRLENTVEISALSYAKAILENPKASQEERDINAMMALYKYYSNAIQVIS